MTSEQSTVGTNGMPPRFAAKPFKWIGLTLVLVVSLFYLAYELAYVFNRDRSHESWLRNIFLYVHLAFTMPILLIPPLQFSRRIRICHKLWHRIMGRVFLTCCLVAAMTAMPLALTQAGEGRGLPTFIFAFLWFCFAVAAWLCARRKRYTAHAHFVIRSYAVALAFVVIRILGEFQEQWLFFISNQEIRDVTRDWLCFVLPLMVVEICCVWWPSVRK